MFGTDFGTTRTKGAFTDPAGKPNIILNDRGEPFTPSWVYFPKSGEPLVGMDAIEQGYIDPGRCVKNFKLKLGSTENLLNNGQVVTATDATAVILAYMKRMAVRDGRAGMCDYMPRQLP